MGWKLTGGQGFALAMLVSAAIWAALAHAVLG